jgi:hypothetical protein
MIRAGSSWCDVFTAPWGVGFAMTRGTAVVCEDADSSGERWARGTGQPLLYLRAAADASGRVCVIGQGNHDGQAWGIVDGGPPFTLGPTHGVFPVLVGGIEEGWVCIVQQAPGSYTRFTLDADGWEVGRIAVAMPPTSQGFLYLNASGSPVTQDVGRHSIFGLALPSPAGDVWVGQSTTDETIALFDPDAAQIIPLGTRGGQPPHIVERRGTFYVCAYTQDGAWLEKLRRPFATTTPPPVIPPPVIPPKEPDVSVRDVPDYSAQLREIANRNPVAFRNAHGDYDRQGQPGFLTEEQANEFIRIAAYELHRIDSRIGLNGKRATSTLSQDALCFRHDDGKESVIDCINGAGGSNPSIGWNVVGHYRNAGDGQRWIQPQAVGGGGAQPPRPGPGTPPPVTTPPASGRPFPSFRVPEDIFLSAYTTYIDGLYARDQIDEPGGWKVCSRGATMWFVPIFYEQIIGLISRKGNTLPTADEWWRLADEGARAAIDFYRRTAPPE